MKRTGRWRLWARVVSTAVPGGVLLAGCPLQDAVVVPGTGGAGGHGGSASHGTAGGAGGTAPASTSTASTSSSSSSGALQPQSSPCTANAQCASGFCVDGVCCDGVCTGACQACSAALSGGADGTCSAATNGTADPRGLCFAGAESGCGTDGKCNAGACQDWPSGTVCAAASCSTGQQTTAGTCDGAGTCDPGMQTTCAPYVCGATACKASCAVSADCAVATGVCDTGTCRVAHSCKELLGAQPSLLQHDGVYDVDFNSGTTTAAWCDMTTDGGGWTALINPVKLGLAATAPALAWAAADLSGGQTCADPPPAGGLQANGWNGLLDYACGNLTFKLTVTWANALGATDVMFIAVVQGDTTHTITVNGSSIPSDAQDQGANCFFWNGTSTGVSSPAANQCYQTYLAVPPHVYDGKLSGNLALVLSAGPGGSAPFGMISGQYGTGMNLQKLFVR